MGRFNDYPYKNIEDFNLDYILKKLRDLLGNYKSLTEWRVEHEAQYEELKALYDAVMSGNFPQSVKNAFSEWMRGNALDLVGELVHMVFFGIENGYFVAYIPESWDEITFGTTGLDDFPVGYDFGHLTLTY